MKVMFICTGNICRSAMAEVMLKKMLKENQKEYVEVYSAGVYADTGDISTQDAIDVMKEYGVNLNSHRATNVRESQIENMDLILCATLSHKATIKQLYPELSQKVYTMKEYAGFAKEGNNYDISDPWGYSRKVYQECAEEIKKCLEVTVKKITEGE